jgi:coenzyme F420-dependent glucose-6-phosphate dehydrogenase
VTHEGEYYRTENVTIYDRPEVKVPIYIGASGPAATRLAGRIADGYITTSGKKRELYTENLLPAFHEGLEKGERAPGEVDTLIEMKVSFDTDRQRAMEDTRNWAALALSGDEKMGVEDPREMEKLADALPLERAASRWIVSTDPDEHVGRVMEYVHMGFRHLVFHAPGPDQARFLELYGSEVVPRLRSAVAEFDAQQA